MANRNSLRTITAVITAAIAILPIITTAQPDAAGQAVQNAVQQQRNPCQPKQQYYKDRDRGWYHNEQCIEPEPEKQEPSVQAKPQGKETVDWKKIVDPKYLDSITAEDFRKLLIYVKDEAVYNPTFEKVHTYMVLQDHARKKSVEFAYVWRDVLLQNPSIDMTALYPASNYGAFAQQRKQKKEYAAVMDEIRAKVGILLFVSGDCPYCHDQVKIMGYMAAGYNIVYKTYTKDYCPSTFDNCEQGIPLFEKFNIQSTPAIVAVYRDKDDKPVFQPISNGLLTLDELLDRLVFYYNYTKTGQHPTS